MSENEQTTTSDGVLFSQDIIEKIFSNLSVKDLRRAAGVCRDWHEMAKKVLSKRGTIESLILPVYVTPYNRGVYLEEDKDAFEECWSAIEYRCRPKDDEELDLTDADWHVSDAVKCVPKIFLIFVDQSFDTEFSFFYEYEKQLPTSANLVHIEFSRILVEGTEICADTNLCAGISIPSTSNLKCDIMACRGRKILKKLDVIETTGEHNCFIFFLSRTNSNGDRFNGSVWKYERYVNRFLKKLREKFKPGTYSALGIGCTYDNTPLGDDLRGAKDSTLFLQIYGSALKTWSVVVRMDLPEEEMKSKLCILKKKIIVNSSTIALCTIPTNEYILAEVDEAIAYFNPTTLFKQVFPSVTLTCVYDNEEYNQFGCNTLDNGKDPVFKHKGSMIYLFITTK